MKDQLTAYVDLLFAGADHAEEIKMEILQNTLDRYNDLIEQGKTPQAAYSLAISGIGDPSDIINEKTAIGQVVTEADQNAIARDGMNNDTRKLLKAISTALYILCPAPLFILGSTFGLVGLLTFVAVATAIAIYCKKDQPKNQPVEQALTPKQKKNNTIHSLVRSVAFIVYLLLSFLTGAWHITWIIFIMVPAVMGIINASMDLKEEINNEV